MLLENKVTNKPTQPKTISLLHRPSSRGEAVKLYLKFSTKKLWIYSQSAYETLSYEAHASSADFRFFFECRNVRLAKYWQDTEDTCAQSASADDDSHFNAA